MGNFVITAAMLNEMCQNGLTVEEMATNITNQAGTKCSVGSVRKACKHYGISLKAKPRKSAFTFESNTNTTNTVEATEEVEATVGQLELA